MEGFAREAKKREIVQLLSDYMRFKAAFGGATPLDSTLNLEAAGSYGPAGLIFAGTEFEREDRRLLKRSFSDLAEALDRLKFEPLVGKHENGDDVSGFSAWISLVEPYFSDPADPSIVEDWRRKTKQGYRSAERFLTRHDLAIEQLADYLRYTDLHVVFPKLMSESEESKMEYQNAEIYAVYQRLRVSGLKKKEAIAQTAQNFKLVSTDPVERIIEFRSHDKADQCMWGGCDRAPFSQNLCVRHYNQQRRAKNKNAS